MLATILDGLLHPHRWWFRGFMIGVCCGAAFYATGAGREVFFWTIPSGMFGSWLGWRMTKTIEPPKK